MKRKKITALVLTLIMATGILSGCGSKASTTSNTNSTNNKNVVITLGCWSSSPAEVKLLDDQIQIFQNENPNITIKTQVITGDYNQAMQTRIVSKTAPDVYYLDVSNATAYMTKGAIAPIDEYLDKADLTDFQPNLLKGFQLDGKTYGLPKDYNTLALYTNNDMLAKAGVAIPTTWDELMTAAQKLTVGNVKGLALADDIARFAPFVFQAGGSVVDDAKKPAFNTPEAAKGMDFYYSIFKKGYAATPKDLGDGWSGDSLAHKHAAMVLEGGWLIPSMTTAAPDVKYTISKLPKGDKEGDFAFTVAYVLNKDSADKKDAASVIKFLTGTKAQNLTAESGLAIPTRISMGAVYTQKHPEAKALVDMTASSQVYDLGLDGSKIIDAINKSAVELRLGKVPDAKTALKAAADSLK